MKKIIALVLTAVMGVAMLSGCGGGDRATIRVYNAGSYIDRSILDDFTAETGIKVLYSEFDSNEDMYVKVANDKYTYDVLVPSDYMVDRLIKEDLIQKLDKSIVTNIENVKDEYLGPVYDQGNEYSVPYMVGTLGILYNKSMVTEPVDSWGILWDEDYSKKIFMWNSMRDAIGTALDYLGYSMNAQDEAQLEEAKQLLIKQKPLVQAYITDEIPDKMIQGEGALALVYSGEAQRAIDSNKDLAYVVPKEGGNKWVDSMVVMKNAKYPAEAMEFINYMCRPDIAKRNMEEIGYSSPIEGAATEEQLANPVMFPPAEVLEQAEAFTFSKEVTQKQSRIWTEVNAY